MVIRECHTKLTRAHELKKVGGETLFKDMGEWTLRTVAYIERECRKQNTEPCIHISPMMLTAKEIEAVNMSDWMVGLEGLIEDVERGKQPPS